MTDIARTPAGVPAGGQFAATDRPDAALALDASLPDIRRAWNDAVRDAETEPWSVERRTVHAIDQVLLTHAPAGTVAFFDRAWSDDAHRLVGLTLPDNTSAPDELVDRAGADITPYLNHLGAAGDSAFESTDESEHGYTSAAFTLGTSGPQTAEERAELVIIDTARDAGAPVAAAVLRAVLDRVGDDPEIVATLSTLTDDELLNIYNDYLGPAIDRVEDAVRRLPAERARS